MSFAIRPYFFPISFYLFRNEMVFNVVLTLQLLNEMFVSVFLRQFECVSKSSLTIRHFQSVYSL